VNKNKRIISWAEQLLRDGKKPMTITEIIDGMRSMGNRNIPSMNAMVNIIGKRPQFEDVGEVKIPGQPHRVRLYILKEEQE